MFETTDSNDTLFSADFNTESTLDTISPQSTSSSSSVFYDRGTLEADRFSLPPGYQLSVVSGNGNIEYGDGFYDTLDLSNISIDSVELSFVKNDEGYYYDAGDGRRTFDSVIFSNGRQLLFEGVERIVFADRMLDLTFKPDDTYFDAQWNLHAMGVQTAWQLTTGTDDVLIGVQDTGLALTSSGGTHPDLQDETWNLSDNIRDNFFLETVEGVELQTTSHGTAVQGIISAETNNGIGIAGINWNSDVYNIDVFNGREFDLELNLTEATQAMIDQATRQGQKLVINMSLGKSLIAEPDLEELVAANQDNVLFVIASGNGGVDRIGDPELSSPSSLAMEYDNVVAVGASWGEIDEYTGDAVAPGQITSYSNYGEGITVMGPTYVPSTSATSEGDLTYDYFNGTSAATPNVVGVASLVWSANNDLSASQVKQIISETAYDLGREGYDLVYGSGLVNADSAVRMAIATEPETTLSDYNYSLSTTPALSYTTSSDSAVVSSVSERDAVTTSTISSDRANNFEVQNDVVERSGNSELPTSLFDYDAPELQQIAKLDAELVREDLYSSPLYQ